MKYPLHFLRRMMRCGFALPLIGVAIGLPALCRADYAVIIGVNQYKNLGANLKGCVNDAQIMKAALAKYGFNNVIFLADADATKQKILAAIKAAPNDDSQRFVLYFAGHGTNEPNRSAALLPSDAKPDGDSNDLKKDELYQAVHNVKARSRTVLLDSCFSGGCMRSIRHNFTTRYYQRGGNDKDFVKVKVNRQDGNDHISGGGGVCYYAASQENQQAAEDDFNGERHGVFTYFLARHLTGSKQVWSDVDTAVTGDVVQHMDGVQHPTLSPAYTQKTIFEMDGVSDPKPKPHSVWDDFNGKNVDRDKVEMVMNPNQTTLPVDSEVSFTCKAGMEGYLVILEYGTSGNINLMYPESRKAEDGKVKAGQTINIPDAGHVYQPDMPGVEHTRAILFRSPEQAQKLLAQFPTTNKITLSAAGRDWKKVATSANSIYTSDMTMEIVPK